MCACVYLCMRLLWGGWQWSKGRKKEEGSNKWKKDAGMSLPEINVASDSVWFIPLNSTMFFPVFFCLVHQVWYKLLFWHVRKTLGIHRKSSHLFSGCLWSWRESTKSPKWAKHQVYVWSLFFITPMHRPTMRCVQCYLQPCHCHVTIIHIIQPFKDNNRWTILH